MMEYQFRGSLNGFNRSDVVACLQNLNEAHKGELLKLQAEITRLKEENTRLQQESEACQGGKPLPAVPASLQQQELDAYRRAEAAERSAVERAEQLTQEAAGRARQVEDEAAGRAEALRRAAEVQILETRQAMNALLQNAQAQAAGVALQDLVDAASGSLTALQNHLSAMTVCLEETGKQLEALQK